MLCWLEAIVLCIGMAVSFVVLFVAVVAGVMWVVSYVASFLGEWGRTVFDALFLVFVAIYFGFLSYLAITGMHTKLCHQESYSDEAK
jgi:hypothetical protein